MTTAQHSRPPIHLAIPVDDIDKAREFYGGVLGFAEGRSDARWIDWNMHGHQMVTHRVDAARPEAGRIPVDGHDVPVPHFGVVLDFGAFQVLADRLRAADTTFLIEPYQRFAGEPGEQWTMFLFDPAGNALEFKSFDDLGRLFAT